MVSLLGNLKAAGIDTQVSCSYSSGAPPLGFRKFVRVLGQRNEELPPALSVCSVSAGVTACPQSVLLPKHCSRERRLPRFTDGEPET